MKWTEIIFNATFGVLSEFKDTSVELAKIQMIRYYLEFVKIMRRQSLLCLLAIFGSWMIANLLVVLEVSILLCTPFRPLEKNLLAATVGLTGLGAVFFMILRLFSQERRMCLTGADRWVANTAKNHSLLGRERKRYK